MKNKLPLIVGIVAIIVVVIIVTLLVMQNGNKEEKGENAQETVSINLEELDTKITENSDFAEMATEPVSKELLETYFQVDISNVENVVGKIPMMNVHASLYVVIEAKDGKAEEVKADLDEFCTLYENQWERYLPDQYNLVKYRRTGTKGNYVYLIIAKNATKLEDMVK